MPTILKKWSPEHQKKYNWLYNYLITKKEGLNKDNYLLKFPKRELISLIKKNEAWGESSKEGLFFMIARWLELNAENHPDVRWFQELGYDIKKKRDAREGENQLDEKEKENFREHSYFVNILDNIKPEDIATAQGHYQYLLLALLTLQPPLRTSYYTSAKFTKTEKGTRVIDENFLLLAFRGKPRAYYIVNKDKASNYKEYAKDESLSIIDIKDDRLVDIIYDSYKKYPRTYLFQSKDKPISQETLLAMLRKITNLPGLTIDMMRASYVTYFYEQKQTYKERDELSKQMRHSQSTASKNYRKVLDTVTYAKKDDEIEALQKENDLLKHKILELQNKLKEYEPDQKIFKKRRNDVLYTLNVGKVKPREDTLKKYNIKLDQDTGKYI
jgi:hypothetical protein